MANNDPLMTVKQLAIADGLSERKIRNWLHGKKPIPHYRAKGMGVLIRRSEFDAWLASGRVE